MTGHFLLKFYHCVSIRFVCVQLCSLQASYYAAFLAPAELWPLQDLDFILFPPFLHGRQFSFLINFLNNTPVFYPRIARQQKTHSYKYTEYFC